MIPDDPIDLPQTSPKSELGFGYVPFVSPGAERFERSKYALERIGGSIVGDHSRERKGKNGHSGLYNVRPPRYLSWFISPITMVYGIYNYSYWGFC